MNCSKCDKNAIMFQPYSGMWLCREHFLEDFDRKVRRSIRKQGSIRSDDRVLVALSGGKDSTVALCVLRRLLPHVEIEAVSIDEGIEGYRDRAIRKASAICKEIGVDHHVLSFKELYGITIDEVVDVEERACTICSAIKRNLLNRWAKIKGFTRLVTGHNLDDEAQSVLMNLFRGDLEKMIRSASGDREGFVRRVKPLREIPEREVELYARIKGLDVCLDPCPYRDPSLRSEARSMLNTYEGRHPNVKYALVGILEKIPLQLKNHPLRCMVCGDPSASVTCASCRALQKLQLKQVSDSDLAKY